MARTVAVPSPTTAPAGDRAELIHHRVAGRLSTLPGWQAAPERAIRRWRRPWPY